MREKSSRGGVDYKQLQRFQQDFCRETRMCVYCLDSRGQRITEISGSREQTEQMQELMDLPQAATALERVWGDSLEDVAIEELDEDGNRAAAVAVRRNGEVAVYWMVFLIRPSREAMSAFFARCLDLLQDSSSDLFSGTFTGFSSKLAPPGDVSVPSADDSYRNVVALARMVRILDSGERMEILMDQWLEQLCTHLQVDTAQLYQIHKEADTMDVLCEWLNEGQQSIYEKVGRLPVPRYLRTQKAMVISSDTADVSQRRYLKEWNLQALVQLPVIHQKGKGRVMLSLNFRKRHIWSMEETMYAEDAVRILQNVLRKRMQQDELNRSFQAMEMALDNIGCSVYVKNKATGEVLFANKQLRSDFAEELAAGVFDAMLDRSMEAGRDSGIYELYREQGNRWYDLKTKEMVWADASPAMLYSLYDISDKKQYQIKIEQQAYTDFLTGLRNRMCCERDLARQVDQAKGSGEKGAFLYLDLDDFKQINTVLGYQYGDVLLKAVSHSLRSIPGIEDSCYRMDGDEFAIVVASGQYGELKRILDEIREVFAKPWSLRDEDHYCTMSMGVVLFPDDGGTVAELIKKADAALHTAKRNGKNCVVRSRTNT